MAAPLPRQKQLRSEPRPRIKAIRGNVTFSDLIDEASFEYTIEGPRATRVFMVENLSGPENMRLAIAGSIPGLPALWDNYPGFDYFPVTSIRPELCDDCNTKARVFLNYGYPQSDSGGGFDNPPDETSPAQIEIVSTVQATTTNKDVNGNQILVYHAEPPPEGEPGPPYLRSQGGEVEYMQPMYIAVFRRRENYAPYYAVPGARGSCVDYCGRVNVATWFGGTSRVWLCTKMDGYSDDNGVTWNNTYEFQRREQTWDATVIYRDPETGEPIQIADPNNPIEVAVVQLYQTADFDTLRLFG